MTRTQAFLLSGGGLGFFAGSSMGIAAGGTAFNAVWLFVPLGAFIGWLIATRQSNETAKTDQKSDQAEGSTGLTDETGWLPRVFLSCLTILASVWNFHIDLLSALNLLDAFVRQPLLFAGLCIVLSAFFPPFLAVYFMAWMGANHFGISEDTKYRAKLI